MAFSVREIAGGRAFFTLDGEGGGGEAGGEEEEEDAAATERREEEEEEVEGRGASPAPAATLMPTLLALALAAQQLAGLATACTLARGRDVSHRARALVEGREARIGEARKGTRGGHTSSDERNRTEEKKITKSRSLALASLVHFPLSIKKRQEQSFRSCLALLSLSHTRTCFDARAVASRGSHGLLGHPNRRRG